jgi:hypothetical protein
VELSQDATRGLLTYDTGIGQIAATPRDLCWTLGTVVDAQERMESKGPARPAKTGRREHIDES